MEVDMGGVGCALPSYLNSKTGGVTCESPTGEGYELI
jgi:hypothetical protein